MTKEAVFARCHVIWALERSLRRLRTHKLYTGLPDTLGDRIVRCLLSFSLDYRTDDADRTRIAAWGKELVREFEVMEQDPKSPVYLPHVRPSFDPVAV